LVTFMREQLGKPVPSPGAGAGAPADGAFCELVDGDRAITAASGKNALDHE
jgi:hypothetical protein